jgi:hypothetical protein
MASIFPRCVGVSFGLRSILSYISLENCRARPAPRPAWIGGALPLLLAAGVLMPASACFALASSDIATRNASCAAGDAVLTSSDTLLLLPVSFATLRLFMASIFPRCVGVSFGLRSILSYISLENCRARPAPRPAWTGDALPLLLAAGVLMPASACFATLRRFIASIASRCATVRRGLRSACSYASTEDWRANGAGVAAGLLTGPPPPPLPKPAARLASASSLMASRRAACVAGEAVRTRSETGGSEGAGAAEAANEGWAPRPGGGEARGVGEDGTGTWAAGTSLTCGANAQ